MKVENESTYNSERMKEKKKKSEGMTEERRMEGEKRRGREWKMKKKSENESTNKSERVKQKKEKS